MPAESPIQNAVRILPNLARAEHALDVNPQCTANDSRVAETGILVDIARRLMV